MLTWLDAQSVESLYLDLSREDTMDALRRLQVSMVPYAEAHALELMRLPVHHRDPLYRMLIAQALAEDVPVMTCDREFRKYKGLNVIW